MDRETKTIETPLDKHKVVIKSWATGREMQDIRRSLFSKVDVKTEGATSDIPGIALIDYQSECVKQLVVSVDDKTEDVQALIENFKSKDFDFIVNEVMAIINEKAEDKKK